MDTFLASLVPTQLVPQSKALHSVLSGSWGQQRKGPQLHPQLTEEGPSCTHRGKGLRVDPASGPHPWVSDLTQPGDRAAHARISEEPPPRKPGTPGLGLVAMKVVAVGGAGRMIQKLAATQKHP